jgi:polyphosphate glucokinase
MNVLVIDVGGTHVKVLATGQKVPRKIESGKKLTPARMAKQIRELVSDWSYDAVSIGYPGLVVHGRIAAEPHNLGEGWLHFDFPKAFGVPVKIVNDAAMQALGSYDGGRMLFIGLGTGLGSAMIVDGDLQPMELAHLPFRKGRTFEEYLGRAGMERLGKQKWRKRVDEAIDKLSIALEPDDVVIGGGNAKKLKDFPKGAREGSNTNAFIGGFRLWLPAHAEQFPLAPKRGRHA